jgi:hypothetical protein
VQALGRQVADADQYLVDLATPRHPGEVVAAAEEWERVDIPNLGSIIGKTDKPQVRQAASTKDATDCFNGVRIRAVEGNPLPDNFPPREAIKD